MGGVFRERGVVLILTLMILSILAVVVIQGMRTMQVATAGAMLFRNGVQADSLALSGIRIAQVLLYQDIVRDKADGMATDTFLEDWARYPECKKFVPPSFETGEVSLMIIDEQGKFPINRLVQAGSGAADTVNTLNRLVVAVLKAGGMGDDQSLGMAKHVVWALKDWMDVDKETSVDLVSQNENAGYANVEEEEDCRNAPLSCLGEIPLVLQRLGLDEDVVETLYFGKPKAFPGLRDLLTVMHTEGVNINTAHPFVLQALARDVEQNVALSLAMAMDAYRRNEWNRDQLGRADWYRDLVIEGASFVAFPGAVTRSSCFSVLATGRVGAIIRTAQAFFLREQNPDPRKGILGNVKVERIEF